MNRAFCFQRYFVLS